MKDLVGIMAEALVDHPDQVEVTEIAGRDTSVIQLKAAKEDMGKIIRMAWTLRPFLPIIFPMSSLAVFN